MTTEEDRLASERRQVESRIEQTRDELFGAARKSLMSEFAAEIAHELNQPLAAMKINAGTSLRWLNREPPAVDEARKAMERLIADVDRASEVVKRTRKTYSEGANEFGCVDLANAVDDVLATMRERQNRLAIELRVDCAANLRPVRGERLQLQQVIFNLVLNAFEALEKVTDRPRLLCVAIGPSGETHAEETHAMVEIRDSGPGVDAVVAEKLFVRLTTTKPTGAGLGLAISKSIVEAHDGRISASAALPFGAIFRFTVPYLSEKNV